MPLSADVQNALGKITEQINILSINHRTDLETLRTEMKSGPGAGLTDIHSKLDAEYGPKITALQTSEKALRKLVADLETRNGVSTPANQREYKSAMARYVEADAFVEFKSKKGASPESIDSIDIGCIWGMPEARAFRQEIERKSGVVIDGDSIADWVTPHYQPGIIEYPKRMPILREVAPVLATGSDTVKIDREVDEFTFAAALTADANSGQKDVAIESAAGLTNEAPFNSVTLRNDDGTTEAGTIASISGNTLTLVSNLANTFTVAKNSKATATQYSEIGEGLLAPYGSESGADYTVNIVDFPTALKVSLNKLRDIPALMVFLQRRMFARMARVCDLNNFYANGQMVGIFKDSAVRSMPTPWSGLASGMTLIDYLIESYYALADEDYEADLGIVNVRAHKLIAQTTGSDGHYIYFTGDQPGTPGHVHAMRLRKSNQLSGNDAVVGDFANSVTIYDREKSTLEITAETGDVRRRRRTMVGNVREGLGIERPRGIIKLTTDNMPAAA